MEKNNGNCGSGIETMTIHRDDTVQQYHTTLPYLLEGEQIYNIIEYQ